MEITDNEHAYLNALMLAIMAPNEKKSLECMKMAASIEPHLTEKQIDLCKKGIEVCMEFLKQSKEDKPETLEGEFIPTFHD
ncbi:hypothetical protein [uncultured Maribacter sp.]|uniref:hypothetical protein n=1 Tax=uncultured Maribacter sp. TaxID=431308 RepID=UPI0030DDC016